MSWFHCHSFTIVVFALHFLLFLASCLHQQHTSPALQEVLTEEKTRLGSTPPSCQNRCNECHPCMAQQVPSLPPSHNRVHPELSTLAPLIKENKKESSLSTSGKIYSNYKPLEWKCRCHNHLFDP